MLKNKASKIVVERGQIVKVSKDKDVIVDIKENVHPAIKPYESHFGKYDQQVFH